MFKLKEKKVWTYFAVYLSHLRSDNEMYDFQARTPPGLGICQLKIAKVWMFIRVNAIRRVDVYPVKRLSG